MSEVASSIHENGIVLLQISSGQMFASNVIGARVWCGLSERQSLETIVTDISAEYQIESTTAREHVERFVNELERKQLIQRETQS